MVKLEALGSVCAIEQEIVRISNVPSGREGDVMFFMVCSVVHLSCHCLRHCVTTPAVEILHRYAFDVFVMWVLNNVACGPIPLVKRR